MSNSTVLRTACNVLLVAASCLLPGSASHARGGEVRTETRFLVGEWSSDCTSPLRYRIYLDDGFMQQGLLQLGASDAAAGVLPETPLEAAQEAGRVTLRARTRTRGRELAATYRAERAGDDRLDIRSLTLCIDDNCRTQRVADGDRLVWQRCD